VTEAWTLKGEMVLSCSCTVFCPCVLSLGDHPPTEERCNTWAGVRIDDGHIDSEDLSGLKVGLMMDLPGIMSRGNWTWSRAPDLQTSCRNCRRICRSTPARCSAAGNWPMPCTPQHAAIRACRK